MRAILCVSSKAVMAILLNRMGHTRDLNLGHRFNDMSISIRNLLLHLLRKFYNPELVMCSFQLNLCTTSIMADEIPEC